MRTALAATIAMFGGIGIGTAIYGVQAQPNAPVYYVFEADVTDPEPYAKEYVPRAIEIMKAHGGRYLAVGRPVPIEGEPPKPRGAILVFDSMARLEAWRSSPEFKANRETGVKYAKFRSYVLEGVRQ
jgi:uncharacterized protein (DUF1330 family)